MATYTNIGNVNYIFKQNETYLSQDNWQIYFRKMLQSGFFEHFVKWNTSTSKLDIQSLTGNIGALYGNTNTTYSFDPVTQSEVDCLYYISTETMKLGKYTNISASVSDAVTMLSEIMSVMYRNPVDQMPVIPQFEFYGIPIAYGIYGKGFWDLSRLIPQNGYFPQLVDMSDAAYSSHVVNSPYCGHIAQYGLIQIYGAHRYDITIASDYSQSELILYPVPVCSMESAVVRIKNESGNAITLKVPKTYHDMVFEYSNEGSWVDGDNDISYILSDDANIILNFTQMSQKSIWDNVTVPTSTYVITQNEKGGDAGDGYSKAEANALFETQAAAEAALALKADIADFGDLASQDTVDYETQVTNKPTLGTMAAEDDAPSDDKFYARRNGTWSDAWSDGLVTENDLSDALEPKADSVVIADEYNALTTYTVGDIVMHDGKLYKDTEDWDQLTVTEIVAHGNIIRYNAYYTDTNHLNLYRGLVDTTVSASTAALALEMLLENNYISAVTTQTYDPFGTYVAGQILRLPNGTFVQLNGSSGKFTQITVEELISNFEESPALTGTPTAPTAAKATDNTQIATTAFVHDVAEDYAPLASPALSGNPTAPTQSASDNSDRIATTAFVHDSVAGKADASDVYTKTEVDQMIESVPVAENFYTKTEADARFANLNSPTFSGSPKAPTAASGTNTTQIASTAFVQNAIANKANLASPAFTGSPTVPTPLTDDNSRKIANTSFVKSAIAYSQMQAIISDLYVDQWSGSDSTGDGTSDNPFATIQKAIDSASPYFPVTVHVKPVHAGDSVYYEAVTISGKIIKLMGTQSNLIQIHTPENVTVPAAINVLDGGTLELYGDFELEGEYVGLNIRNNSSVLYRIRDLTDKLSVIARGTSQNIRHNGIEVYYGSKFMTGFGDLGQTFEVDISTYPTNVSSSGIRLTSGSIVSAQKVVMDMSDQRQDQIAISNDKSIVMIEQLLGTYGTAYSGSLGFKNIGNVS